ncbi:MAG: RtcB family protein [Deltaproteobacteria bacterium]|nr:RtcB family protein [Deltaproteobacteria bacterium]
MKNETKERPAIIAQSEAVGILPVTNEKVRPITVIGTQAIRDGFDATCLQQAINSRLAPGVTDLVLNPDGHAGYGAPVGCVLVSPTHIYPGPVGVDIKCSMSLLQLDVPDDAIADRRVRRALIEAICERTPTGPGRGQRSAKKARKVQTFIGKKGIIEGASKDVCEAIGIPWEWSYRCEDSKHVGHDDTSDALASRLELLLETGRFPKFEEKVAQLGSYGGGNHFGECNAVRVGDSEEAQRAAKAFGLVDGQVSFLSHCGSRGFGHNLAMGQFAALQGKFNDWSIPFPGDDRELVYAPLGTQEANDYIDDMSLGANFATINHLLINALVLEAFQEVLPGARGKLVYFISHNIARKEVLNNRVNWVHRKGATRAFPAGHHELKGTPFENVGHPILLPGNPREGSAVMVASAGAEKSCFSVNHGAGRAMGRKAAMRALDQKTVDAEMDKHDILSNCRQYPLDEAPDAYKDFREVLKSVETAGLATTVATLKARFVIKDGDDSLKGAA